MQNILNTIKHKLNKERVLGALILLVLLGIAYSLYSQYLVPYLEEIETRKQDEVRVGDINKLDEALKATLSTTTSANLKDKTVYISLPSESPTCEDLELPKLPVDWKYNCVANENLTNADGTGWIPVDLSKVAPVLLIDQTYKGVPNTKNKYYTAIFENGPVNTETNYWITAQMLNKKSQMQRAATDGGADRLRYEKGTDSSLAYKSLGEISRWSFDDITSNSEITDATKNGNSFNMPTSKLEITNGCKLNSCLHNPYQSPISLRIPSVRRLANGDDISYGFWFKNGSTPSLNTQIFNPGTSRLDVNMEMKTGDLFIWFLDTKNMNYPLARISQYKFDDKNWHLFFLTKDSKQIIVYFDNEPVAFIPINTGTFEDSEYGSISLPPDFKIDEVSVYNRSISENEVENIYNSFDN